MSYPTRGSEKLDWPAPVNFLVQPSDMDVSVFPNDSFGKREYEEVAYRMIGYLVHLRRGWIAFDLNEFMRFAAMSSDRILLQMVDEKLLVKEDENYRVTIRFVTRYFASAPGPRPLQRPL